MPIVVGDRVTVSGIPGVHAVKDTLADFHGHPGFMLTLGRAYGWQLAGEACPVEAWRCDLIPVDLGKKPA